MTTPSPSQPVTQKHDFLSQLRRVNTERYHAWVGDGQDAGIMFDAMELGGEVGELLNVVKKLVREEAGWRGSRADPADFADECADVLICLDKLARRHGVDLTVATVAKFNATSEKNGFPHRLATSADQREGLALRALRLVAEHETVMARLEPDAHDAVVAALSSAGTTGETGMSVAEMMAETGADTPRRAALRKMAALDEEAGFYDRDNALPLSPNATHEPTTPGVVALTPRHRVVWSDDRLGQAFQLLDEAYQEWPSESGPGEAIRVAREAVEAADMELPL